MLSQDTLSQLQGLKAQMEAEKEYAEAVIKGTQARYGFAVLDDGREIFHSATGNAEAFPDDRVRICIRPPRTTKPLRTFKTGEQPTAGLYRALRAQGQRYFRGARPAAIESLAVHTSPGAQRR